MHPCPIRAIHKSSLAGHKPDLQASISKDWQIGIGAF
jgi:hypothetical protein